MVDFCQISQSLIVALVLSRLDYCNSVLAGLPVNLIRRLQSAQNAAARLTFGIRRSEHITYALASLLTSSGSPTCHPDCGFNHLIPINLWCHPTISLPSAGGPSQSSPPIFGIVFLRTLLQHRRSRFSGGVSRLTSFGVPTLT